MGRRSVANDSPTVEFEGTEIDCEEGDVLRNVLLSAGESPLSGPTNTLNCGGHSTCGTCAVAVEGETADRTDLERWRLSLPRHRGKTGLRLACQTRVEGDLRVRKHDGVWGQHVDEDGDVPSSYEDDAPASNEDDAPANDRDGDSQSDAEAGDPDAGADGT